MRKGLYYFSNEIPPKTTYVLGHKFPSLAACCNHLGSLPPKFNFFLKFYLFLAALGLHCCARAFSSCSEWGLLFVAVRGLLTAVASLVVEHGL